MLSTAILAVDGVIEICCLLDGMNNVSLVAQMGRRNNDEIKCREKI